MKRLALLFALANIAAAQNAPHVQAETSGICSPVVQANQGKVQITCDTSMDEATRKKIVALLNQILTNTKDVNASAIRHAPSGYQYHARLREYRSIRWSWESSDR